MATLRSLEDYEARNTEIRSELAEIDKEHVGERFPDDVKARWHQLNEELEANTATIDELRTRQERIAELADQPGHTERGEHRAVRRNTRQSRVPDDIHDLPAYRRSTGSDEEYVLALRDGAMQAVENMQFPHERANREEQQGRLAKLLDTVDKRNGTFARRLLATSSPVYDRAFGKHLAGQPLTDVEQRALGVGTQGGSYAVPVALDPTVILTSNGQVNPIRQISRVVTITGETWNGVASTGISAAYSAEAVEASDNSPTLTQPTTTVSKAKAFVPFSIELGEDWGSLQTEMARMLQDAKDALEATKFLSGSGSSEPQGLLVGATQVVSTTGTAAFVVADLYSVVNALPERWQPGATIVAHRANLNRVRQFDTAGGASLWVQLAAGTPQRLLDYPTYMYSAMASVLTSGSSIVTVGDFSQYVVVDRIGMNIEVIPHLFGTALNYPTGQRGLFAYWRNSAVVTAIGAFKTLKTT